VNRHHSRGRRRPGGTAAAAATPDQPLNGCPIFIKFHDSCSEPESSTTTWRLALAKSSSHGCHSNLTSDSESRSVASQCHSESVAVTESPAVPVSHRLTRPGSELSSPGRGSRLLRFLLACHFSVAASASARPHCARAGPPEGLRVLGIVPDLDGQFAPAANP
jgi:hypothetical protein